MAQLDPERPDKAGAPSFRVAEVGMSAEGGYDIPASTQLLAIAWLRWRIFANGFRRRTKSGKVAGVVISILLRILLWPIFAMWVIGPAFGSGFLAWSMFSSHHPERLAPLLAGIALGWQFVAINGVSIAATMSTFDPTSLLRYPLRFGRYLVLRMLLGLLTPSTLIGCGALLGVAIGITVADVSLAPAAVIVLATYAAMNLIFSRMVAIWMERLLSKRRAREIFGGLMALFFVSIQFLNFRHTTSHGHGHAQNTSWLINFVEGTNHSLAWLPPGFATQTIVSSHPIVRIAQFTALLMWTAAFLAAFAYRLQKQFLGEYLSEGVARKMPAKVPPLDRSAKSGSPGTSLAGVNQRAVESPQHSALGTAPPTTLLPPILAACLRKEWLYLRSNGNQLIAMLTPLAFVFIFSRGMLAHHPDYLLPGAIGYAVMGLLAQLYNIFGADGAGMQLYLLAPVRLRDVVLAKNITNLSMLLVEVALAWTVVFAVATDPIPPSARLSAACWIVFILFTNLTVGTLRSIQSPSKVSIAQTRRMRPAPASKTSGLIVLAILFGCVLLQVPVVMLCRYFHNPWLAVWIFAPLAVAAIAAYAWLLQNAERLILSNRDQFAQELCGE